MTKLSNSGQIWNLKPTESELKAGAEYATLSLPWTFNRMMLNTSSKGQQSRALNIAKGIVGQQVLRRKLISEGVSQDVQLKSYRDDDLFDFRINSKKGEIKLDVKSLNYYKNYAPCGRDPLSNKLIISNADYTGPDWRKFFPMLVPHTQIDQKKEAYCFAIASSIDIRNDVNTDRCAYALTAFPYGESLIFLSSGKLCQQREEHSRGFYIQCTYESDNLLSPDKLELSIIGEWDGKTKCASVSLKKDKPNKDIGPFSCIAAFQLSDKDYDKLYGRVILTVSKNDFKEPILNSLRTNINQPFKEQLILTKLDFCNLILPSHYELYFIGWINKPDYLSNCRKYVGYIWPNSRVDRFANQIWDMITENDMRSITRAGFNDCIQSKPKLFHAGWLKTTGRGGGACCYVFPNVGGAQGGVRETNLYVLPQDLQIMNDLGK